MRNNYYFEDVIKVKDLFLEYIFLEFEKEPILFLCSDLTQQLYLCLCTEIRYRQRWIVIKTNILNINRLINEKIDLLSAFLEKDEAIVIDRDLQGKETSCIVQTSDIDKLDLPKEGVFLKGNKEKIRNFLWLKKAEKNYKEKIEKLKVTGNNVEMYNTSFTSYHNKDNERCSFLEAEKNNTKIKNDNSIFMDTILTETQYYFCESNSQISVQEESLMNFKVA